MHAPRRLQFLALSALLLVAATAPAARSRTFNFADPATAAPFTAERGHGFDFNTSPATPDSANTPATARPFFFSIAVPEGNHRVAIEFGATDAASDTTVKVESRQLFVERVTTRPGEFVTRTFIVNIRTPRLPAPEPNAPGGSAVLLNDRERDALRWDDKLTLEFTGPAPRVRTISVEPAPADTPTVFLAGDSTVTDQPAEPAASWGQMLPRFFNSRVAIANHAESGETLKSFLTGLRLAKILSQIRAGDYLFIQFGHNDQKQNWPQTYAEARTTYAAYLRAYIAEARLRGATPVLVTSPQRRTFDAAGRIKNTHGDYPAVVRELARAEHVALIDLERASVAFYEALGPDRAPLAFNNGGQDATHHNNYGAYELAKAIVQSLRDARLPLADFIADDFAGFDPAQPDAPETFALPASVSRSAAPLRGN